MNRVLLMLVGAVLTLCVQSCSKDTESIVVSTNLVTSQVALIKNQIPNLTFDETRNGIYHGVIASGTNLSRGKIWINIGNDGNYNATIEMVEGSTFYFGLKPQLTNLSEATVYYEFVGTSGNFLLDLTNITSPEISSIILDGASYFGSVVKSRSFSVASVITATFYEYENPSFSGTWSLISDGTNHNPNGNDGDGITSLVITFDGNIYEDLIFDNFNASSCLGNSNYTPTINSYGISNYTISDYQTTEFGLGMTKWSLGYDATNDEYMNWMSCGVVSSGSFSWTSADGTIMRLGEIIQD